ncbi:MAG: hypothetical protein HRU31_10135 [Rhodobacteraceae bacterium]|nr:hypothetical protein [Paracoccaceae bacterium]
MATVGLAVFLGLLVVGTMVSTEVYRLSRLRQAKLEMQAIGLGVTACLPDACGTWPGAWISWGYVTAVVVGAALLCLLRGLLISPSGDGAF